MVYMVDDKASLGTQIQTSLEQTAAQLSISSSVHCGEHRIQLSTHQETPGTLKYLLLQQLEVLTI